MSCLEYCRNMHESGATEYVCPLQVTSPLTQLTLQPSSPFATTVHVKEEPESQVPVSCCLGSQPTAPPMNKDQMLQEKDRRIQELTRMLLQKQQLVESLRSQLEGKHVGAPVRVKGVAMEIVPVKEEVIEVREECEMVTEPRVIPQAVQMQAQLLQQRMQTAVEPEQERQQQLVLQQNQRNLQQQVHQRKRKTQKQQHSPVQARTTLQKQVRLFTMSNALFAQIMSGCVEGYVCIFF